MRKAHAAFQHGSGDRLGRFEGAGPQGAAFPVGREKGLSGHFLRRIAGTMDKNKATLIGMGAIVLWSTLIGLVRSVSEALGPVGGAAMIYTASAVLSYGLAFSASILWATYCTITVKMSRGHTGVTFFLLLTALALWLKFLLGENPPMRFDWKVAGYVCMAALAVGYGYAAWNKGIVHGNTAMLAAASYFTPVISSAIAAVILDIPLTVSFWQGAVMVCIGSLMCWVSTRKR